MRKTISAILAATILATSCSRASADANTDYREHLRTCEERAEIRSGAGYSSVTNSAINGGAQILGALLGGRDPSYAISGAAQSGIQSAANDARMAEMRRRNEVDRCIQQMEQAQARKEMAR